MYTDHSERGTMTAEEQLYADLDAERHLDLMDEMRDLREQYEPDEPPPTRDEIAEELARGIEEERVEAEDPEPEHRPHFELDRTEQATLPVVREQLDRDEAPTVEAMKVAFETLDRAFELVDVVRVDRAEPRRHPSCTCEGGMFTPGCMESKMAGETDAHCPVHGVEDALRG